MQLTDNYPEYQSPVAGIEHGASSGKTWCKRLTGIGGPYGFTGEWCQTVERDFSRSGSTGTLYVLLPSEGVYLACSRGRHGYWQLTRTGEGAWILKSIKKSTAIELLQ